MGQVTGQVTTFDRKNYTGPLYLLNPTDTPYLSMAGGLQGGRATQNKLFTWQTEDLEAPSATGKVEGATPDYAIRTRSEVSNVVQIFYKGVEHTYSALDNMGLLAADAGSDNSTAVLGDVGVNDPVVHQLQLKLLEIKRDMEKVCLEGVYANPATNAAARGSRGIIPATTTNEVALDAGASAPADIAGDRVDSGTNDATLGSPIGHSYLENLLKDMFDNGADMINPVVFVNSFQKVKLTRAYTLSGQLAVRSNSVGGVAVDTIITDFGMVSLVLNRWMPTDTLLVSDMAFITPRWFEVPGMGFLFLDDKPADGASQKLAFYGEFGLEYGPEKNHGKITNLTTS